MWKDMHNWTTVMPPSRPGQWDIQQLDAFWPDLRPHPIRVLVLGSTIEYRLYAASRRADVTVVTNDTEFHLAVSEGFEGPLAEETLIVNSWEEYLLSPAGQYDLILSDLTSGNIQYTDRRSFYRGIAASLFPDGLFVDKYLHHPRPGVDYADIARRFSARPITIETLNEFNCIALFCSEFVTTEGQVDTSRQYEALEYRLGTLPGLHRMVRDCELITPSGCRWYYGLPSDVLDLDYYLHLSRVAVIPLPINSPYFGWAEIRVSRGKR